MNRKRNRGVMLSISVLLHGLLALLPWQEKSRPLLVSSTPTSPIRIVDASELPTLPALGSQTLQAEPPSPPAPDPPQPDPIPDTSNRAIDELALEAVPEAGLTPEPPIPETSDNLEPASKQVPDFDNVSAATSVDETKIEMELESLVGYFGDQHKTEGLFPASSPIENFGIFAADLVDQFFDAGKPKFDEASFSHFQTKTPEQVFETVVKPELMNKTGFEYQRQENFSDGLAYQLLQGEMLRYLIIVRLGDGNGSFLMLSESLPGLES